mmetsp:Transcript_58601/g.156874  ORF Transcript_58601/g.156874 Transcript_58601/m.156874 type:complete len:366 (-) Transcript_58601:42-1139(-)
MAAVISCRFAILGSGGSCSLPNLRHVLQEEALCGVCQDGFSNPFSKNCRGNPCLLVSVRHGDSQEHVLIDCGKTFEEAVRRHFRRLGVRGLNAIVLTHGHADAILGLDSLREVQLAREAPDVWTLQAKTPLFASATTMKEAWHHFHYMFPKDFSVRAPVSSARVGRTPSFRRRSSRERIVGGIYPREIHEFRAFCPVKGLQVLPIPVLHGGDYVCLGFAFGVRGEFVYLSDVSAVPEKAMEALQGCAAEVLVLDSLLKSGANYSHFGMPQALELVRALRPKRTLLLGMSCQFDHDRDNEELRELAAEGLQVELSYDGLCLDLDLTAAAEADYRSSDEDEDEDGDEEPFEEPLPAAPAEARQEPEK